MRIFAEFKVEPVVTPALEPSVKHSRRGNGDVTQPPGTDRAHGRSHVVCLVGG